MKLPEKIYFVTGNAKKWEEVHAILGPYLPSLQQATLDLPEPQGSIHDIALAKCRYAAQQLSAAVITEDTALVFTEMNGMPGPYVKWFLEALHVEGLARMAINYSGTDTPPAQAICTMAFCLGPEHEPVLFQGITDGVIVPPRGPLNFGWDPIFMPLPYSQTYAEMPKDVKNAISHRSKALDMLKAHFTQMQNNN